MPEISDKAKKTIDAMSVEDMLYEINLGRRSRFQREKFAYLKTIYETRAASRQSPKVPDVAPSPTTNKAENKKPPDGISLRHFAFAVVVIIFATVVIWVVNHYFSLGI